MSSLTETWNTQTLKDMAYIVHVIDTALSLIIILLYGVCRIVPMIIEDGVLLCLSVPIYVPLPACLAPSLAPSIPPFLRVLSREKET